MLDTPHKKKSLLITILLHVLLLLLLFYFGLSYLDPATEEGIAINFGYTEVGSGKTQPKTPIASAPNTKNSIKKVTEKAQKAETSNNLEKVITQENTEAPTINNKKATKQNNTQEETQNKKKKTTPTKEETSKPTKTKPIEKKPDSSTKNALDNFLNGAKKEGQNKAGEGNDNQNGDKGNPNGDPNAKSYYGNGKGLDGDGNYRLGGRKALNKEKNIPNCNETGTVVVKIIVDQNGKVIQAFPGIKGTTNTAPCLMQPAKKAALATKFNSDNKAPSKQTGSIIYIFKLSE